MGVVYYVISSALVDRHPFAVECLQQYDIRSPVGSEHGRHPTPQELRIVLDELVGYTTEYSVTADNWQASVEATGGIPLLRPNTLVEVIDFRGDEAIPHDFCFEKGNTQLAIYIVERLSGLCGPLYVFPDAGARPNLVTPGTDPVEAVKEWELR